MSSSTIAAPTASRLGSVGGGLIACYLIFVLLLVALMVAVYWKMFSKAGYSGWLSLLMFVPFVNFGMMLFLAFSDWPVLRELRMLRSGPGSGSGGIMGYPPPVNGTPVPVPSFNPQQTFSAPPPPARGIANQGYAPPVPTVPSAYAPVVAEYIPETLPATPPPAAPVWEPIPQVAPQPQPQPQPAPAPAPAWEPQPAPAPQPAPQPAAPAWEPQPAPQPAAPAWEPPVAPAPEPAPAPQPAPEPPASPQTPTQ